MPSFTPFPQLQCQFSGCHSQDIYIQSNLSHDWLLLSSVSLLFLFLRSTCNQCCSAFFSSSSSSSVLYLLLDILSCRQLGICCFFCFFCFFQCFFGVTCNAICSEYGSHWFQQQLDAQHFCMLSLSVSN